MRLAVLDLGSNSFHLLVVEVEADGGFQTVTREKVVLRLGEEVAASGVIGDEAADQAVAAAAQLKAVADATAAADVVAVATNVFRSAANGEDLADRISAEIGAPVWVLSGDEEARLTFDAVRASVLLEPGPALALDLGGGSLEVMVGDRTGMRWSRSVELGAARLTGELVESDPTSDEDQARVRRRALEALGPLVEEVRSFEPKMLVGSSGTIGALARAALAAVQGDVPNAVHQATVGLAELKALEGVLLHKPTEERARLDGVDSRRAPIIPAGYIVVTTAMEAFGFDEITLSEWALREGVVLDAIRRLAPGDLEADAHDIRMASTLSLCRRCSFPEAHSRHVAGLAVQLFDQLAPLHGLGENTRELLECAALLHDIGEHVAREDHERHSAYLILHGRLRGFTPDEVAVLASVCRYHRRGTPKAGFEPFGSLDGDDRGRATALTALLRLADVLDRSHAEAVSGVSAAVGADEVVLKLAVAGDITVELLGLPRKAELLERTFGRRLTVEVEGAAAG